MLDADDIHDRIPVACTLEGGAARERAAAWEAVIGAALREREATPTGVRLTFAPDHAATHTLVDLVAGERDCCGWASWTLTTTGAATVVEATTGGGQAAALQAMFD